MFKNPWKKGKYSFGNYFKRKFQAPLWASIHPSIHHIGCIITIGFCWLSFVGMEERDYKTNVVLIWSHILKKIMKCYLSTTTRRIQLTSIFFNKMEECCVVELSLPPCYLLESKNMSWLFWPTYSISSFFFFSLPTYFWLTLLVTLFNFVSIKFWSINVVLFYYCYKFIFLLFGSMLVATFANHNNIIFIS